MRKISVILAIVFMITLDQWVKGYVVKTIPFGESQSLISGILSLTYLKNYGAAFSILQNQQGLFLILTVLVMVLAIRYLLAHINDSPTLLISLSLVVAGGLGNFIDRLRFGYVIDMFQTDFVDFAIFNVADAYLTLGVILLFTCLLKEEWNGNRH